MLDRHRLLGLLVPICELPVASASVATTAAVAAAAVAATTAAAATAFDTARDDAKSMHDPCGHPTGQLSLQLLQPPAWEPELVLL